MMITKLNIVLMLLFVLLVGTVFLVRRDYTERNIEILPGMVAHVAYPALSGNSATRDGKLMQAPVEGTVARGYAPVPYQATPADARRAGEELRNPLPTADSVATVVRGATVFATMCAPCHGLTGTGDGIIPQRGFPPPPSLFAEQAMKMKDGQMFHVITFGQANMPALAAQVGRDDRWRVISYIRSLQLQHNASTR